MTRGAMAVMAGTYRLSRDGRDETLVLAADGSASGPAGNYCWQWDRGIILLDPAGTLLGRFPPAHDGVFRSGGHCLVKVAPAVQSDLPPHDPAAQRARAAALCPDCQFFKGFRHDGLYAACVSPRLHTCCGGHIGEVSLSYGSCPEGRWR